MGWEFSPHKEVENRNVHFGRIIIDGRMILK
jgi:hypothetical protein